MVVYNDDVDYEDGLAELYEERAGVTAFEVIGTAPPKEDGEGLPRITILALDPSEVCAFLGADISSAPPLDEDD